jgi:drug/metabolite transporter (DMT)-like permease
VTHLFLYALALFFLSQSAALAKFASAPPEVIGSWRMLAAALCFLLFTVFNGSFSKELMKSKSTFGWLAATGFFFFLHLWTFFFASQNTLIAHTMILFCLNPLFVGLGSWWIHHQRPTKKIMGSYVLSFVALFLLLFASQKSSVQISEHPQWMGDLSAFASAVFFAVYFLLSQKCRTTLSNSFFSGMMYLFCAAFFFIMMTVNQSNWIHYPPNTWLGILGQVIFSTLLGHALISYLMKHLDVTWMATGKLSEPIMATIVAYWTFGETISIYGSFAFLLTGASLFLLLTSNRKSKAS